jgi:hypothetical protein
MGEIAEMMINGLMCEGCGEFMDDMEEPGYVRYCSEQCAKDRGMDFEDDEEDEPVTIDDIECSLTQARVSLEIAIDDLKELKMKGTKELSWLIKRIIQFEQKLLNKE